MSEEKRKLAKDIAEIILNQLNICTRQEVIHDEAYIVSNKIAESLSIDVKINNPEKDETKIIQGKRYIVCCENGVFGINHNCRKGTDE